MGQPCGFQVRAASPSRHWARRRSSASCKSGWRRCGARRGLVLSWRALARLNVQNENCTGLANFRALIGNFSQQLLGQVSQFGPPVYNFRAGLCADSEAIYRMRTHHTRPSALASKICISIILSWHTVGPLCDCTIVTTVVRLAPLWSRHENHGASATMCLAVGSGVISTKLTAMAARLLCKSLRNGSQWQTATV
jgi:hypothetical protein